jgi:hypothetical protein
MEKPYPTEQKYWKEMSLKYIKDEKTGLVDEKKVF